MKELILGGARSGKSLLAEKRAAESGRRVIYLATAEARDGEMSRRITHHRERRPPEWGCVEETLHLAAKLHELAAPDSCILVDCLTLWLSNLLYGAETLAPGDGAELLPLFARERAALLELIPRLPGRVIFVANEVGLGLVPETPLGRLFRDEAGRLNQAVAALADRVVFVAAGLPLVLKA